MQRFLLISGLLLALLSSAWAQQKLPEGLKVKNLEGQTVDLREQLIEGEVTVLSFWATWCSPCKKELDNMKELYPEWREKYKVQIIAISVDDARTFPKVKGMVKTKGWEYTILSDQNQDLQRALNFQTVPQTFLINQKGEIIYAHSGYKDGDEFVLEDKIKAAAAAGPKPATSTPAEAPAPVERSMD